jgi:flagellar assembly protein FliH
MSDLATTPAQEETPEKLTAWERWELPNFESHRSLQTGRSGLPTAVEIEEIQRVAREEGFRTGYAEGVQKAAQENQRLSDLIGLLEQQVDEQVSRELLDLSLGIARQVIQQSLKVQPDLLLCVVREAIGTLPVFNQAAHLILSPDDAALVRERMSEQLSHSGWKILEDARMGRGNARLETSNSQVDASLEARWKRVTAAMGQDSSWLIQE